MTRTYKLHIKLLSRAAIASAEGYGALIDTDIVFDDVGLPYIPARRIKGCFRDSAIEVLDMLTQAKIEGLLDLTIEGNEKFKYKLINDLFGIPGMGRTSQVLFSNLYINNYELVRQWLRYLIEDKGNEIISKDAVIAYYTDTTNQTAIDKDTGTAKRTSLRTIRSLKSGIEFIGELTIEAPSPAHEMILCLAAINLRSMGSLRTRGFGRVKCEIDGIDSSHILKTVEGLCIN
ncbi:MAG: RAMP superfamily CRISPR-associated protein [Thermodesulfovibrionales bacterium]